MSPIDHLDLVVTSLERSLGLHRALLVPLHCARVSEIEGERAGWLREQGAAIRSGPEEYDCSRGYCAVLLHDPDAIKLELVHRPAESALAAQVRQLTARPERLEQERDRA